MIELAVCEAEEIGSGESYEGVESRIADHFVPSFKRLAYLPAVKNAIAHLEIALNKRTYCSRGYSGHRDVTVLEWRTVIVCISKHFTHRKSRQGLEQISNFSSILAIQFAVHIDDSRLHDVSAHDVHFRGLDESNGRRVVVEDHLKDRNVCAMSIYVELLCEYGHSVQVLDVLNRFAY